jgi:hypothetical protein
MENFLSNKIKLSLLTTKYNMMKKTLRSHTIHIIKHLLAFLTKQCLLFPRRTLLKLFYNLHFSNANGFLYLPFPCNYTLRMQTIHIQP